MAISDNDTEMKLNSLTASSMVYDSVRLPIFKDELSSNLLRSAFRFIDMLKVWAIVFRILFLLRQKLWRIFGFSDTSTHRQQKKPTQPPYQFQLSSSLIEEKREVLVYEYIDRRWNLEVSHYPWKQFVPTLRLN